MDKAITTPQLLNRLRMRQIALLLGVEEKGTLRAASSALGLSQPAATKMLHELEQALGGPLFDRVGRSLQLNDKGRIAMDYFRGVRGTIESLNRELAEFGRGGMGQLRVGSIMAASPDHLTDALVALKEQFPLLAVKIEVGTSDRLMEQLDEGAVDLVVGRVPLHVSTDYVFNPMSEEALAIVVGVEHPLRRRRNVSFADLQSYAWILQPPGSPMRDVVEHEFRSNHTPLPRGLIETASVLTTTNLIAKSSMVAVIPQSIAGRYEQRGLLRRVPYQFRHQLASYGTIFRRDRPPSLAARRFVALLHGGGEGTVR